MPISPSHHLQSNGMMKFTVLRKEDGITGNHAGRTDGRTPSDDSRNYSQLFPRLFDPSKPANNSSLSSAEMRGQLTGLNHAITDTVNAAIAGTSNNTHGVGTLVQVAGGGYDPSQMQAVLDKTDELINALRR